MQLWTMAHYDGGNGWTNGRSDNLPIASNGG
jgi:hypothetical protein